MPHATRPGDVLADRYRLVDLLTESGDGRFWRAHDRILERHVALHVIRADDERAAGLMAAARRSAPVLDRRILRVLDADITDDVCYVVNEWGWGTSLDVVVAGTGPLGPRRAAWLVSEVAESIAVAHAAGVAHGRLNPENVLIDREGGLRIIGLCVDAALHGLPPERLDTDVSDLAGLLYCALTTKWAGASSSLVDAAPTEHGRVLRPRRVRAGIPRTLDALCDEVLQPTGGERRELDDVTSARGIADHLNDFVGDPTGLAEALIVATPPVLPDEELVRLPPVPEMTMRDAELASAVPSTVSSTAPGTDDEPYEVLGDDEDTPPEQQAPVHDLPTEAGLPIFGEDGDDVSWLQARTTPAAPPPPFEEPAERPLFAPSPTDGVPVRQIREGSRAASSAHSSDGFWPWESNGDDTGTGGTTSTSAPSRGSKHSGPSASGPTSHASHASHAGRSWLRLAAALAAVLLLLVAVVVAVNLGRGRSPLGAEPEADPTTTTPDRARRAALLTGLVADDLDPQGDTGEENGDEPPLAVDGDPATSWPTQSYVQQFGPDGLKTGVGLTIDLGASREVTSVDLTFVGSPTGVSLYVADAAPDDVVDLAPVATGTASVGQLTLDLDEPTDGRFLVVWLTSLPNDGSEFRGQVAEVAVRGR